MRGHFQRLSRDLSGRMAGQASAGASLRSSDLAAALVEDKRCSIRASIGLLYRRSLASSGNMPRKANRWADDFAAPRNSSPVSPNASEYHLIELTTGLSHGGFASLAGARQCAREKDLPAWDIFQWQCLGQVSPSAVEQWRCLRPAEVVDSPPAGLSLAAHRPMVGPTNDIKIYVRYFFRHRAMATHRTHNSKAARALRRATSTRAGRSGPHVPDVLLD